MVKTAVSLRVYGLKEEKKRLLVSITSLKKGIKREPRINNDTTVYKRRTHPYNSEEKLDDFYLFLATFRPFVWR